MIKKLFEINKSILQNYNFYLFYGINEGSKNEKIGELLKDINKNNIFTYEENQILNDVNSFLESVLNKSLFEEKKIIIVKRATNKILDIIKVLVEKNSDNLIVINSGVLDKKSKLRNYFEKEKKLITVAFYEDTVDVLSNIAKKFLKENNITLSQSDINLIINKCVGDRGILLNELDKIKYYLLRNKKIKTEDILKLINLAEDHSISELIDNCLAKNNKKTINILNENNLSSEDCIMIMRVFLNKSKKIYNLCSEFKRNNNIELTISSARPPIFWKDKEIVKKQINQWTPENIKKLIFKINEIELQIKKNIGNSVNLISDFIIDQSISKTNN